MGLPCSALYIKNGNSRGRDGASYKSDSASICYDCGMTNRPAKSTPRPICGIDLERWRVGRGLTKASAADLFGLQPTKWEKMTCAEHCQELIDDPALALLLYTYENFENALPLIDPDVKEFYEFLGLRDVPQDKERFATLIGRSTQSVYRFLDHEGKPGRPVVRWIQAVRRLNLKPNKSLRFMAEVVSAVGEAQQVKEVLVRGWTRPERDND